MAPTNPEHSGAPDAEIVRLVREGGKDAFAELVRRTHRPAYRLAFRMVKNHEDADGVLHESYINAYRALNRFDSSRAIGPWMVTIVARTVLRSPPRAAQRTAAPLDDAAGVERAFAGLPEEHRAIIALWAEGDLAYAEIADVLGIPVGTVMSRLAVARDALLEELRKTEGGKGAAPKKDEALHPPRAVLFAYRDGELSADRRVLIEAHVVGCRACRTLIDDVSGIEAALKRAPHDAPPDYYEKLPGAVLERLVGIVPDEDRTVLGKPDRATIERRKSEDDPRGDESGRVGAPPRLPWAAIVSTVLAAAVVVVVVFLLARQGAIRRAVSPPAPVVPEEEAPVKAPGVAVPSDSAAPEPALASEPAPPPMASTDRAIADHAGSRGAYGALLSRFGLPPVWSEVVPAEALERAEPELRYLYQVGRADSDSARVRLYLAEAARLRYVPGRDTTLYYKIVRHYRRAIRLQGSDSDVGRIARERLDTLRP